MSFAVTSEGIVPFPNQVAFWHASNYSGAEPGTTSGPQFLTCLKATELGDRQLIWQGRDGGGITAVVDFGAAMRRLGRLYYRWGCITSLDPAVPFDAVAENPILGPRLTGKSARALQGKPVGLTEAEAAETFEIADLPVHLGPLEDPSEDDLADDLEPWGGPWTASSQR